jgi:DNA-binding MarR family transcriptional regulator
MFTLNGMVTRSSPIAIDQAKCHEMVTNCACFNFRKASRSVTQLFDQTLSPIGLRSTQLVILLASQELGASGMVRLARELVMDRSTITRNLQPLISQGFLNVSGKSGRAGKKVEITPAGQKKIAEAVPYWEKAQSALLSTLGQDRWTRVMRDLHIVVANGHNEE